MRSLLGAKMNLLEAKANLLEFVLEAPPTFPAQIMICLPACDLEEAQGCWDAREETLQRKKRKKRKKGR
jgi:hypothetical protein